MIKGIAAKLVSHLFSEYIERIDASQLELQIWNGVAKLENLSIRPDALTIHQLPFAVKKGTVGSICLKFPWGNLGTQPCVVDIEDVFLVATIAGGVIVAKDLEVQLGSDSSEVSEGGKWSSLMNRIVDNIQINVRNVHIRVENPTESSFVAFGVTLKSLATFSVDETGQPAFLYEGTRVLRKKVEIDGLAVYIDTGVTEMDVESYFEMKMLEMIGVRHQYLLKPFSFNGLWTHYRDTPDAQDGLKVVTQEVLIGLDANQWQGVNELGRQYQMFNKRRMYSHLGKPDRLPRSERSSGLWWNYANRCARYDKLGDEFDVGAALEILRSRSEYLKLAKEKDSQALEQYEDQLDPRSIVFLRGYAQMKIRMESKGTELSSSELQELVRLKPNYTKSTAFHVLMDKFQIAISDRELKPITLFVINGVAMDYVKTGYDNELQLAAKELNILNELSERYHKTFSSGEMKYRYVSKPGVPSNLEFETSKVFAVLDLNWAAQLAEFFKRERLVVATDTKQKKQQIQAAIDQHMGIALKVQIVDVSLLMPYQEVASCPCLKMDVDRFCVDCTPAKAFDATNYESLYETYNIKLGRTMFALEDKVLTNEFDMNISWKLAIVKSHDFDGYKLTANMDNVEARVSLYQYLMLLEMLWYFIDCLPEKGAQGSSEQSGRNTIAFAMNNTKLSIFNQEKQVYEVTASKFDVSMALQAASVTTITLMNTTGRQFINDALPQFAECAKLVLEYSQRRMNVHFVNSTIDSYSDSIQFILEFLSDPATFEKRMQFPVTFDYTTFEHKRATSAAPSVPISWLVNLEGPTVNMYDSNGRIGRLVAHGIQLAYSFEDGARKTELTMEEPCIKRDSGGDIISFTETLHLMMHNGKIQTKMSKVVTDFETGLVDRLVKYGLGLTLPQPSNDKYVRYTVADIDIESISGNYEAFTFDIDHLRVVSVDDRMDALTVDLRRLALSLFDFEFIRLSDLTARMDFDLLAIQPGAELSDVKADSALFEKQKEMAAQLLEQRTGKFWVSTITLDASLGDLFVRYSHKLLDDAIGLGFKIERHSGGPAKPRATDVVYNCKMGVLGIALFDTEELLNFRVEEITCSNGRLNVKSVTESVIGFVQMSPVALSFGESIALNADDIVMKIDETNTYRILSYISLIPIKISTTERRSIETDSKIGYDINIGHAQFDFEDLEVHSAIAIQGSKYQLSNFAIKRCESDYLVCPFDISMSSDELSTSVDLSKIVMNLDVPDVHCLMRLAESIRKLMPRAETFTPSEDEKPHERPAALKKPLTITTKGIEWSLMRTVTLSLEMKPFGIDQNLITTAEIFLCLKHQNHTSGNTDMIIERTRLLIVTDFHDEMGHVGFEFDKPFNVNITADLLDSILHAKRCLASQQTVRRSYSVQNMYGTAIRLDVAGEKYVIETGSAVSLGDISREDEFKLTIGMNFSVFRMHDLCYPMAVTKDCVVSLLDGVVTVSSPYIFRNMFGRPLTMLTVSGQTIAVAEPHSDVRLPSTFDRTQPFVIAGSAEFVKKSEELMLSYWNSSRTVMIATRSGTFRSKLKQSIENDSFGIISVRPTMTLWNELPEELEITADGVKQPFKVKPGNGIDIPKQLLNDAAMKCKIQMGKFASEKQELIVFNKEPQPIFMESGKATMILFGRYESGKFCFFAPCIVKNDCPFRVDVRTSEIAPHHSVGGEYLLLGAREYASSSKMSVSYRINHMSGWSQPFDCVSAGVNSVMFAPIEGTPELFVPIRYGVSTVDKTFEHTRILTFSTELSIVNETDWPATLRPLGSVNEMYRLSCTDRAQRPVLYVNQEFNFEFSIGKDSCSVCLSSPCQTTFRLGDKVIGLDVVEDGNGRCAHFKRAEFPTPIVVSNNLSGVPISVWQVDEAKSIEIPQSTTTWFAFEDPLVKDPSVHVKIGDFSTDVPISSNFERRQLADTNWFVDLSTTVAGHRILVVNGADESQTERRNLELTFKLETLNVSLIDSSFRELALMQVRKVSYRSKFEQSKHLIEFKIQGIQVDDQYTGAVFPVVISGKGIEDHAFFHLSAVSHRDSPLLQSFSSLCLSIQRIDTFIDLAFVSDLVSFFTAYAESDSGSLATALSHQAPQQNSSGGALYSFGVLVIHPILFTLTFRGNTRRDFSIPQTSVIAMNTFKFIPSLTSAPIEIPSFTVENFIANKSYLKLVMKDEYHAAILSQVWKLAGHLDIFFNAGGIARTIGKGFKSTFYDPVNANVSSPEEMIIMAAKGGGELIKGTVGSIIKGGEGFVRNISSYVSMLDPDRKGSFSNEGINQSAGDTVIEGFKALGTGLFEGLTGIVKKPVEGGEKEGFEGVLSGIGKGLIGLVAKPVSGFLECGAGDLGGVRKAISDEEVIERIRLPRVFPMATIDCFRENEAEFQWLATRYDTKNGTLDETMRACIKAEGKQMWLGVGNRKVFMFLDGEVVLCRDMSNVLLATSRNAKVILSIRVADMVAMAKPQRYIFEADSVDEAKRVVALVHSRSNLFAIFSVM